MVFLPNRGLFCCYRLTIKVSVRVKRLCIRLRRCIFSIPKTAWKDIKQRQNGSYLKLSHFLWDTRYSNEFHEKEEATFHGLNSKKSAQFLFIFRKYERWKKGVNTTLLYVFQGIWIFDISPHDACFHNCLIQMDSSWPVLFCTPQTNSEHLRLGNAAAPTTENKIYPATMTTFCMAPWGPQRSKETVTVTSWP